MRYSLIISTLQNLTNKEIRKVDIANALGWKFQKVANRSNRDSEFKLEEVQQLEKYFNVNILSVITQNSEFKITQNDELFNADFYENIEVSCGGGICTLNETKKQIQLPKELAQNYAGYKKYSVVRAVSDSMTPYIQPKDYLIIEESKEIENNKVYVFLYGDTLYCKNLSNNIGQLIIRSLNKDYPTRYIEGEDINNIHIIGKVVGVMRNID